MMSGNCRGAKLRTTGWILLALALGHVPAKAEDSQVKRGPTPDWVVPSELMPVPEGASGMLFVRRQDIVAHLDDQGQAQYLGYRMRLLLPNALQPGNIPYAWDPASGPPAASGRAAGRERVGSSV